MEIRRLNYLSTTLIVTSLGLFLALPAGCKKSQENSAPKAKTEAQAEPTNPEKTALVRKSNEEQDDPTRESAPEQPEIRPAAQVKDRAIAMSELEQRHFERTGEREQVGQESLARTLEILVEETKVEVEAANQNVTVTPEDVQAYLDQQITRHGSAEAFAAHQKSIGSTPDAYRARTRAALLRTKLRQKLFPTEVAEEELQNYYNTRYAPQRKGKGLRIQVATITLKMPAGTVPEIRKELETKLARIKAQLDTGTPFAELARENSQDAYAKQGGKRVWAGKDSRPPDLFNACKDLPVGEVVGPIQTSEGIHLVEVLGRKDPNVGSFEEERDTVRRILESGRRSQAESKLKRYLEKIPVQSFL